MKAHPYAELFPMMDAQALADLARDIGAHGQREKIVLLDGAILDGRNRLEACEKAGVAPQFRDFEGSDPLAFVLSLNLARRHLNESQRAMVAARLETMKRGNPGKDANLHVSRAQAADLLHVAPRTVAHAAVVRESAAPELKRAVDQGKLAVSAAAQAAKLPPARQREIAERAEAGEARAARNVIKQGSRDARERSLAEAQRALPKAKFGVILADPEWRFEVWSRATGLDRAADNHYPTSSIDEIAARNVASIAADDCVLFLWATVPMTPQALATMSAWGFRYVSHVIWSKDRAGTGYWFRNWHELLLVGVRGKPPAPAMGEQYPSVLAARVGEHSAKPEAFLEMIERYFPRLPKIELNRRGPARPGWAAWGNEAGEGAFEIAPAEGVEPAPPAPAPQAAETRAPYAADRSVKWGAAHVEAVRLAAARRILTEEIVEATGIPYGAVKGIARRNGIALLSNSETQLRRAALAKARDESACNREESHVG